jgi:hypothetical protein
MDDTPGSYTVKKLFLKVQELETLERAAKKLPVEPESKVEEDPGIALIVSLRLRRKKLDESPEVRRFMTHVGAEEYGETNAKAISRFIYRFCKNRHQDKKIIGELPLDEFCDVIEDPRDQVMESTIPPKGFAPGSLADLLVVSSNAIRSYAKAAGVNRPKSGQRNWVYPLSDVRLILLQIISKSPRKCTEASELLRQVDAAISKQAQQKATAGHQ